jgi:branched-subunit amino acid aminotransferase/4-amino-4-deoxychorismate lyase
MPDPDSTGWVDGRITRLRDATIPIDDPAFHTGLGLYETFGVTGGSPLDVPLHFDRLERSAERIAVSLPARDTLTRALRDVAARLDGPDGWLKLVVTRGGRCVVFGATVDVSEEARPSRAVILPWRRNLVGPIVGLKSLNVAELQLGFEEAARRGADEGLWLNTRGHLAEGCRSNLFLIERGKLYTPGLRDGILPGIVRQLALRAAKEAGVIVHEGKVRVRRLRTADEAFLTSSVRGVRSLISCDARPIGSGRPGPLTARLAEAVGRLRRPA